MDLCNLRLDSLYQEMLASLIRTLHPDLERRPLAGCLSQHRHCTQRCFVGSQNPGISKQEGDDQSNRPIRRGMQTILETTLRQSLRAPFQICTEDQSCLNACWLVVSKRFQIQRKSTVMNTQDVRSDIILHTKYTKTLPVSPCERVWFSMMKYTATSKQGAEDNEGGQIHCHMWFWECMVESLYQWSVLHQPQMEIKSCPSRSPIVPRACDMSLSYIWTHIASIIRRPAMLHYHHYHTLASILPADSSRFGGCRHEPPYDEVACGHVLCAGKKELRSEIWLDVHSASQVAIAAQHLAFSPITFNKQDGGAQNAASVMVY